MCRMVRRDEKRTAASCFFTSLRSSNLNRFWCTETLTPKCNRQFLLGARALNGARITSSILWPPRGLRTGPAEETVENRVARLCFSTRQQALRWVLDLLDWPQRSLLQRGPGQPSGGQSSALGICVFALRSQCLLKNGSRRLREIV